ncbi:MAG TPA: glycoside hydrolase [Chromatiaceae bacterium]|jgi:alpha-amylase/alpha-mannosidase (GH57 family)|nr:glycoside hydrolase [Chromatiaceae bacterium]HIN82819.1 glycoside hydrolase [Chromatiales bacterium]HIO15139.1 glycoside hydrolase [Chromatiales bacterium]HIO54563.1 glycoside hydrolase [Chromatiales bacterium]
MNSPLKVVLCWHMHQPQYRDPVSGNYQLPWTYLHATKDYADMAAWLEADPQARAVVNFAPILLEQIDDYAQQIKRFCAESQPISDPLLAALAQAQIPQDAIGRQALLTSCLRANQARVIERYSAYQSLCTLAGVMQTDAAALSYMGDQYFVDLVVWYHLVWLGESVHQRDDRVRSLVHKQSHYTDQDRAVLIEVIGELLSTLIDRYRRLADSGQVELAVSPYAHPILPLLLDFDSAREAMPDVELPQAPEYPGGEARTSWQLARARDVFRQYFQRDPIGCWPSEGGVSQRAAELIKQHDYQWIASGQNVLANSLERTLSDNSDDDWPHRAYQVENGPRIFFRDDGLSDLIGFSYATWHADDAVANLIHHLETISRREGAEGDRVVSIIMDGENAWEFYPQNARHFIPALYKAIHSHTDLELTTFADCLDQSAQPLPQLVSGSWVYGTFSTWIGDPDKNMGWNLLVDAKQAFDGAVSCGALQGDALLRAETQLAVCEGSDWFWWFGDYNPEGTVSDFEQLFRRQLSALYRFIGQDPPASLGHSFTHGQGQPGLGGVMRHGSEYG